MGEDGRRVGTAVLRALRSADGVASAQLNYPLSRVVVEFDELDPTVAELCDLVAEAADLRGPHRVVTFAQETAKEFHQFYNQCRVIGESEDIEQSRLALCRATKQVLATALGLVGVEAPEQM